MAWQPHAMICNHNLPHNAGKGERGGTGKTLWDSPLEETSEEKQRHEFHFMLPGTQSKTTTLYHELLDDKLQSKNRAVAP